MAETDVHKESLCAFDYLTGTIATAYKGPVQSLVISDFCIDQVAETVEIKGRIINLPDGIYKVAIISEGKRLSELETKDGTFNIRIPSKTYTEALHLQIDLTQRGRHIGTFLIKSPSSKGPLLSAMQVAKELRGLNLRMLVRLVEGKVGLHKRAEHLVSAALSSKRKWADFSSELYSFSKDLFWSDRRAFSEWLGFIVRFFLLSIKNLQGKGKPVTDLLSIIELVSDAEDKELTERLLKLFEEEIRECPVDLTARIKRYLKAIINLIELSGYHSTELAVYLTESLLNALKGAVILPDDLLTLLGKPASLKSYSKEFIEKTVSASREMLNAIRDRDFPRCKSLLKEIDLSVLDSQRMLRTVFSELRQSENPLSVKTIIERIAPLVSDNPVLINSLSEETASLIVGFLKDGAIHKAGEILNTISIHRQLYRDSLLFRDNLVESIFETGDREIEKKYLDIISEVTIPPPQIGGYDRDTWEPLYNRQHLERITRLLRVSIKGGYRYRDFLTRLIANFYMIELFILDEAVFQRHITEYLNSVPLKEDFILHYLLLKRLPVYYNEVGASGRVRDLSTELDSWGNDPVLYFLRKQVHVNNGPQNIKLIERVLSSWKEASLDILKGVVPDELLEKYPSGLLKQYSEIIGSLSSVFKVRGVTDLVKLDKEGIKAWLDSKDFPDETKKKLILLISLYKELNRKYALSSDKEALETLELIDRMHALREVFTSSKKTVPEEQLYYKRHIAFGIPSVMGTYQEEKFDALKEFLKKEEALRASLEEISTTINKTKGDSSEPIIRALKVFYKTLRLPGFKMPVLRETCLIIENNTLYISQIIDLIRGLEKELIFVVETFYRWFLKQVSALLKSLDKEQLDPSLRGYAQGEELTDVVLRRIITSVPGIQEYDRFLNNLLSHLLSEIESNGDRLINAKIKKQTESLYLLERLSPEEAIIACPDIGSKAKNLAILLRNEIPVPPGIVLKSGFTFDEEDIELVAKKAIGYLEEKTGRRYGKSPRPLFVSVRSGSFISMPGILDTILYCGINRETLKAMIEETSDRLLGWDSYRRFLEHYLQVVYGIKRDERTTSADPEEVCNDIVEFAKGKGISIPDDPWIQLFESVKGVCRSWHSERAKSYRKAMSISEHWGTAVLIMPMVTANSQRGGASVFFTRDPKTFAPIPYGETRMSSTGDDIVYGGHLSMPISRVQRKTEQSLQNIEPELYELHAGIARRVEDTMDGVPQEIEAAYLRENNHWRFFVLQSRAMEFYRNRVDRFHEVCRMESNILTRGIGVHGGALSGVVTFQDDTEKLKNIRKQTDTPIILIRKETSTSDAKLMPFVDGLLTSTGGVTSHASVLAKKFDLTAVVGCQDLQIDHKTKTASIGEYKISEGTPISIDGATGLVYKGTCPVMVKEELS